MKFDKSVSLDETETDAACEFLPWHDLQANSWLCMKMHSNFPYNTMVPKNDNCHNIYFSLLYFWL